MPTITPEFEKVVQEIAPKNGAVLLENFKRMASAADETAKALIGAPDSNKEHAKNEVEKLFKDSVPIILKADPAERLELIHELNNKLTPLAGGLGAEIELVDIAQDQAAQTAAQSKIVVGFFEKLLSDNKKEPAAAAPTPAPVVVPPVTPTPAPVVVPPVTPTPAPVVVPPVAPTPAPVVVAPVAPTPAPVVVPPVAPTPAPVVVPPVAPTPAPVVVPVQPAPTTLPFVPTASPTTTPEPAPGSHEAVSEAPTYERTRNYKSGHSKVRGVKPGFDDMPSIEAVKSRTLTGQVDIEGFDMDWRDSKWYKRFIEAAVVLKFCAPLMDKDAQAWIAEVQPAIDVFAGLKDVPKNKWKREIWKFVAMDRKVNAPMIYAPGGALNFLLAFDRLLDVQPEVRVAALAGNAADLNKLNIAWIRMEKGVGKKRTEKAKERRATVRTYAAVVGSVPVPVVLPAIGATVPPAPVPNPVQPVAPVQPTPQPPTPAPATQPVPPTPPTPGSVPPTPVTAPGPAPAPDVNTYNPTMDTSPDKLKFGVNQDFANQYLQGKSENFPDFLTALKIFTEKQLNSGSFKAVVDIHPSSVPENEADISTPELDTLLADLSKDTDAYWLQFGINFSNGASRTLGLTNTDVMKKFSPDEDAATVLTLFNSITEFKRTYSSYFFDVKRPIALKLQKLYFWAGKRIFEYASGIDGKFKNDFAGKGAMTYFSSQLLEGPFKDPQRPSEVLADELWQHVEEPLKSAVLRHYKDIASAMANESRSMSQAAAKKWLEDNKTELDALTP